LDLPDVGGVVSALGALDSRRRKRLELLLLLADDDEVLLGLGRGDLRCARVVVRGLAVVALGARQVAPLPVLLPLRHEPSLALRTKLQTQAPKNSRYAKLVNNRSFKLF